MKKNKKYWKKEAKGWKEVARIESEEANNWAKRALEAERKLKNLTSKNNVVTSTAWIQPNIKWTKNTPESPFSKKCKCNCDCKK